ncbi:hydroxymethylglutaryl-CoA lyase [Fulvitalea axinellae]|uniref:Hydroxymethylglutaryl-CoA lyase n=1 Tax=Fulvitalea axinellae TaxID=1182444 RepID=A0AAU9DA16_9BACT|nr:hydroxymethylglutaryl-CoA lyase [Fulvitalea axinellae]
MTKTNRVKITECPRDAMQGLLAFVPTELKIKYLSALANTGFDTLDFTSFVSPKAIPQMRDASEVTEALSESKTDTELLAIVANLRGAQDASNFPGIDTLGYPFSVSETFQLKNTKKNREESLELVKRILEVTYQSNKKLRVYLSMAFGNPYGEEWSPAIVLEYASKLIEMGVHELALSDTTGTGTPSTIEPLFAHATESFPDAIWMAHLHATPKASVTNIEATLKAGCRYFDSALGGYGGCPMAKDDLTGNIATETLIATLDKQGISHNIDTEKLKEAQKIASEIFV